MNILSKKSGVNTRVFPIYTPLQVLLNRVFKVIFLEVS